MFIHASRSGRNQRSLYLGAALADRCLLERSTRARTLKKGRAVMRPSQLDFLLDIDNTLLANDRFAADLDMTVEQIGVLRVLSLSDLHASTAAPAV